MRRRQVSVIGSGEVSEPIREKAFRVGRLLGERDVVMVCGGGGGVMEAASEGIQESGGGLAVGIRPESDDSQANQYLDVVIPTGIGQARNVNVVLAGQAIIAVDGAYGTLSELAYAQKFGKPVFGIGTWEHERFNFDSDLSPSEAVERALEAVDRTV